MNEVITMNSKEANRIAILEKVKKKEMKQNRAAKILGLSVRQIRRLGKRYKKDGSAGIIHQLRGLPSNSRLDGYAIDTAVKTIRETYYDFGPTFAHEKLVEKHGVTFSRETLRKAMILDGIWIPKRKKAIVLHPLRDRRSYEGELVQLDGSPHAWFETRGPKCTLLVYIDDATGKLLWLEFVTSESTQAYFTATKHYLLVQGKPGAFYVDKHGVFRVNSSRYESAALDDTNGLTQFGRAMHQLGIEVIFANSAQAKGRVEKVNQTLQDRLVKELRLQGISTMQEGNLYLPTFMEDFNRRFAVVARYPGTVHRPLLPTDNLDDIFCQHHIRVLSKQLTVSYQNMRFQIQTKRPLYAMQHAKVTVKEDLMGVVSIAYKGTNLSYTIVEQRPKTTIADSKTLNQTVDQFSQGLGIHITPVQLPTSTTKYYVGQSV